ncbi:MAG: hypothetical protein GY851_00410 [bacterium]|nr:hypothetical protein [bacterium]
MKRLSLILIALIVCAGTFAHAAFPTNTHTKSLNMDKLSSSGWRDFRFNLRGYQTERFVLTPTNNSGFLDTSDYNWAFKGSKRVGTSNVVYILRLDSQIDTPESNVVFTLPYTNIPPNDTYNGELWFWSPAATNQTRTAGRGTITVLDSLYDDEDGTFPYPTVTNLSDYLTIADAASTYLPITATNGWMVSGAMTGAEVSNNFVTVGNTSGWDIATSVKPSDTNGWVISSHAAFMTGSAITGAFVRAASTAGWDVAESVKPASTSGWVVASHDDFMTGAAISNAAIWVETNVLYVGKHGNDSNSGRSDAQAKLTFANAIITVTNSYTPAALSRWVLRCNDSAVYTESMSLPSYVGVEISQGAIVGNVVLADDSRIKAGSVIASSGVAVWKTTGSGKAYAYIAEVECAGAAHGIINTSSGSLFADLGYVAISNGYAIGSTSDDELYVIAQEIKVRGTGIGVGLLAAGEINGTINCIEDNDAGTGVIVNNAAAKININVRKNTCATPFAETSGELNYAGSYFTGTPTGGGHFISPHNGARLGTNAAGVSLAVDGDVDLGGNTVTNGTWTGTAIADAHVADNITASSYLPLAGGTMSGDVNMGGNNVSNITFLASPGLASALLLRSRNVEMGAGEASQDIDLKFNGDVNDGNLTWRESLNLFDMSDRLDMSGNTVSNLDDQAYGAAYNGNNSAVSKNAIYDKIETLGAGGSPIDSRAATNTVDMGGFPITDIDYTTIHTNGAGVTPVANECVDYIIKVGTEWRRYWVFHDGTDAETNYFRLK